MSDMKVYSPRILTVLHSEIYYRAVLLENDIYHAGSHGVNFINELVALFAIAIPVIGFSRYNR